MAETKFIEPDLDFIARLKENGGDSLKKCYQCATCSVVCNVTPDPKPFPRKEMIWAQWGLKEKLMYNPDVWLCLNCGDCTDKCPRDARPSDVIGAIRNMSFKQLAVPTALGNALSKPSFLLPLFLLPIALLFIALLGYHGGLGIPEGEIVYSKLFPILLVDSIFVPVAFFIIITSALGIKKFWNGMKENYPPAGKLDIGGAIVETVIEILTHKKFADCNANKSRRTAHLLLFFGFAALFITTNAVLVYHYLFQIDTPLALSDPVKILGNIGAVIAFIGITLIFLNRVTGDKAAGNYSYYDKNFIFAVFFTVVTGIFSEIFRLADIAAVAYTVYFTHLVFVFFLLAYLPFSKFAHMLYRTTALIYSKAAQRQKIISKKGE
ncbi:MAG: quinone-interacting membrane-bound oxidoreductase complex subunit QmoC [Nitrospinota bacterium]